jgi:hypothetical protein
MSIAFHEILRQVRAKAPKAVAEMAHYHAVHDDATIPQDKKQTADRLFTWIECTTPPPRHPIDSNQLTMSFVMEVGGEKNKVLYAGEDGELTDDPEQAIRVSLAWTYSTSERARLRAYASGGIRKLRQIALDLGIPARFIRDNDR